MSAGAKGCEECGSQYEAEPVPIRPACAVDPTVSAAASAATTSSAIRPSLATVTPSLVDSPWSQCFQGRAPRITLPGV